MPELLLKMSMAAGQLRGPLLEVHRVMQVRGGKMKGSHFFTSLSLECTEGREAELQGMEQEELPCVTAKTFIRIFSLTACYKQGTVYFFNFIWLL